MKNPKEFHTTTSYTVLGRVKIKDLLAKRDYYAMCYFVVEEEEDPILVRDSISWLNTQKPSTKVYILKFRRESSKFTK